MNDTEIRINIRHLIMPRVSCKLNHHLFVHNSSKLTRNSTCKRTKLSWTLIPVPCYCDCFLKKWLYWDINVHTEKNWDLSSVVRNMHSLIEHLNKNTPKKSLDFIVMPIVYAKCICHDAVLTFPCAWVTIKRKREKISYFCVRPINDNSIFFLYYPISRAC